jgi:hypothetical protein
VWSTTTSLRRSVHRSEEDLASLIPYLMGQRSGKLQ